MAILALVSLLHQSFVLLVRLLEFLSDGCVCLDQRFPFWGGTTNGGEHGESESDVCLYGPFISQGILDNSRAGMIWFNSSVAALLVNPMLIITAFPNQGPGLRPDGQYQVRLYDPEDELDMVMDSVNDLVPIAAKEKGTKEKGNMNEWANWTPVCYKTNGPEIYLMLLEKAAAKLLHPVHTGLDPEKLGGLVSRAEGYDGLEKGGCTLYAWALLTGLSKALSFQKDPDAESEWAEMEVSSIERFGYACSEVEDGTYKEMPEFFARLAELHGQGGYILGASVTDTTTTKSTTNPLLSCGIVAGHVYGIQQIKQVSDGTMFVHLRNPWSDEAKVYNGPYGPESNMWHTAEGSMYAAELGDPHYEEGLFWMEWYEFLKIYDTVLAMEIPR